MKIFKYVVPVDGQRHEIELRGRLLAVGCRNVDAVEFWAVHDETASPWVHVFGVVGTGQPFPEGQWRGTAVVPGGQLVWHLIEHEAVLPDGGRPDPGE